VIVRVGNVEIAGGVQAAAVRSSQTGGSGRPAGALIASGIAQKPGNS